MVTWHRKWQKQRASKTTLSWLPPAVCPRLTLGTRTAAGQSRAPPSPWATTRRTEVRTSAAPPRARRTRNWQGATDTANCRRPRPKPPTGPARVSPHRKSPSQDCLAKLSAYNCSAWLLFTSHNDVNAGWKPYTNNSIHLQDRALFPIVVVSGSKHGSDIVCKEKYKMSHLNSCLVKYRNTYSLL